MADIVNPEAVKFSKETLRVMCEEARAFKIRVNALRLAWYAGMNAVFSNPTDVLKEGREAEGVPDLLAGDVTNAVAQLIKIADGEAAEWNDQVIQKPCVRTLP